MTQGRHLIARLRRRRLGVLVFATSASLLEERPNLLIAQPRSAAGATQRPLNFQTKGGLM